MGVRYFNIPHFSDYLISFDGKLISGKNFKNIIYEKYSKKSGFIYRIYDDEGKQFRISINELLMMTFYGITNLPIYEKVHIDKSDYDMIHISNLYYDNSSFINIDNKNINVFYIMDMEYRVIPNTDNNLFINKDGGVYNFFINKFVKKTYAKKTPYPRINISYNKDKVFQKNIHRVLGEIFLPDFKKELYVNHKDAKMYNSFVSNLEMVTPQENVIHASTKGLIGRAYNDEEIHKLCKLLENENDLQIIQKEMEWEKLDIKTIYRLIYRICNKEHWKHISSLYDLSKYQPVDTTPRKYNEEDIHKVCQLLQDTNKPNTEISDITGIPGYTVQGIRIGKQWKHISIQYNINYKQLHFKLPEEKLHKICKLLEEGKTNVEISKITKVHPSVISPIRNNKLKKSKDIIANYNIPKNERYFFTEEQVRTICEMIINGKSNDAIANIVEPDKYRVDQNIADIRKGRTYTHISKEYGLPNEKFYISPNDRHYVSEELKQKIFDAIRNNPGMTRVKLGELVGVHSHTIKQYSKKLDNLK